MIESISCVIPEITVHNNRPVTTSLAVANFFQKLHKDILRKIATLECTPSFTQRNFTLCHENNELQNGKPQPVYEMTKNGFIFLVMGFTGKKAAAFKEAYIAEFDRMESELIQQKTQSPAAMPIFPLDADFDYITRVRNGVPEDIQIIPPGKMLLDPADAIEMLRRMGMVSFYYKETNTMTFAKLAKLSGEAEKEEKRWLKVPF
jgi:Rha family phage regulatory protein